VGRLERNPTVKAEIQQKGLNDSLPAGFLCYPVSQAADITAFKAELVPVGDDQLPMIEQTNEIVRRFNRIYQTECLKEAQAYLSHTSRLIGLDGKAKASKSLGNVIYLSETPEELKQKVFSMFTDPDHLKVSDPGKVEGNVVFAYLDAFHPDKEEVAALKAHYQRGGLGDVTIKNLLLGTLKDLVLPMAERRAQLSKSYVQEVLHEGTRKARAVVCATLEEVRDAMCLRY
jgi:tryptophanyl-tRNA synthetase